LWVLFALLDLDSDYGSGSTDLIFNQKNRKQVLKISSFEVLDVLFGG
jgi:hypothetical protein